MKLPDLKQVISLQPLTGSYQLSLFNNEEEIARLKILAYIDFLPKNKLKNFLIGLSDEDIYLFYELLSYSDKRARKLIPSFKEIKRWNNFPKAFREHVKHL